METGGEHCGFSASEGIETFLALRRKRRSTALQGEQSDSSMESAATLKKRRTSKKPNTPSTLRATSATNPSMGPSRQLSGQSSENLRPQRLESKCLWTYPVPPRLNSIQHTYIASNYILQRPALVSALTDPKCGGIKLIERDFEYLRHFLPPSTKNRDTTRVEADLILDEANAVLLYPLSYIGQASLQDTDEGLNELRACIDRIARRYSVLWLILEEYTCTNKPVGCQDVEGTFSAITTATKSNSEPIARVNPYTGPVVPRLASLLSEAIHNENHNDYSNIREGNGDVSLSPWRMGPHSRQWGRQVRVLFASSEETTAMMIRRIGDGLVRQIEEAARAGLRREHDGWRNGDEWLSRDWLNQQDSTHERFLSAFQIFNPFSVQAILSLCPLREFLGMSTQQRQVIVSKFINRTVLAQFNRMLITPLSDTRHHSSWL